MPTFISLYGMGFSRLAAAEIVQGMRPGNGKKRGIVLTDGPFELQVIKGPHVWPGGVSPSGMCTLCSDRQSRNILDSARAHHVWACMALILRAPFDICCGAKPQCLRRSPPQVGTGGCCASGWL